jgi:hypothetical protein
MKVAGAFMNWMRTAAIFFLKALESWTFVHTALADKETTRINAGLLRLRDSRTKNVTTDTRATLGAEVERCERLINGLAADHVGHKARLAGSDSSETMTRLIGHFIFP